jgi:hypothetical protein
MAKNKEIIDPVYDSAQRISYVMMNQISLVRELLIDGKYVQADRELESLQQYSGDQFSLIMEEKREKEAKAQKRKQRAKIKKTS